jgi:hypothetical protein
MAAPNSGASALASATCARNMARMRCHRGGVKEVVNIRSPKVDSDGSSIDSEIVLAGRSTLHKEEVVRLAQPMKDGWHGGGSPSSGTARRAVLLWGTASLDRR